MHWNTFVMRLWSDRAGGKARGEIVHLQTKETAAFASWDQAAAFMRRFVPLMEADHGTSDSSQANS